jgi:flagella basal body P-ring formation protein FlgA
MILERIIADPAKGHPASGLRSLVLAVLALAALTCGWSPALAGTAAGGSNEEGGADNPALQQQTIVMTSDELAPFFKNALFRHSPWPADDIEITRLRVYPSKTRIPAGELSVEIEPPPNGRYLGRVSLLLTLRVDGQMARTVRVSAWVEVYRPVLCATRALARGHVLGPEDLRLSRRPLSRLRDQVLSSPEGVVGLALKRSVQAGQVMTDRMLTPPVIVRCGDRVTILAQSQSLTVTTPGKVKQDGSDGDYVRVENLMSEKEILAKVVSPKTVVVNF